MTIQDIKELFMSDEIKNVFRGVIHEELDPKFASIDQKFAQIDQRFDRIEHRLDSVEKRLDNLELTVNKNEKARKKDVKTIRADINMAIDMFDKENIQVKSRLSSLESYPRYYPTA